VRYFFLRFFRLFRALAATLPSEAVDFLLASCVLAFLATDLLVRGLCTRTQHFWATRGSRAVLGTLSAATAHFGAQNVGRKLQPF
jgi:hypothetical protein